MLRRRLARDGSQLRRTLRKGPLRLSALSRRSAGQKTDGAQGRRTRRRVVGRSVRGHSRKAARMLEDARTRMHARDRLAETHRRGTVSRRPIRPRCAAHKQSCVLPSDRQRGRLSRARRNAGRHAFPVGSSTNSRMRICISSLAEIPLPRTRDGMADEAAHASRYASPSSSILRKSTSCRMPPCGQIRAAARQPCCSPAFSASCCAGRGERRLCRAPLRQFRSSVTRRSLQTRTCRSCW
jgi:hypothetical protein